MSSESYFQYLKRFYGEAIFKHIKLYEETRKKKSCRLCDLTFLKRCRDNNVIPNFLRLNCHIKTKQAQNILKKTSKILLRERVQYIRKELDRLDRFLLECHLLLSNQLNKEDWDSLNDTITRRIEKLYDVVSSKQKQKFNKLYNLQHPHCTLQVLNTSKLVVNKSKFSLSDSALSVLSKGLNFAVTPRRIPYEEIITAVDSTISKLPEDEAEEIRLETVNILKKAKPPKKNLSRKEYQALKELRNNEELVILPADKGKVTVLLNKDDYIKKAHDLLNDPAYEVVNKNPISSVKYQTTKLLKNSKLDKDIIKKLTPTDPYVPRFYGLPKIHKNDVPLRPIVNCINSCTYELSKYLDRLLRPFIGNSSSYVKDSRHFIDIIKNKHISTTDLLVSFDVSSLFTKIPIKDTLSLLEHQFSEDIVKLFRHCLTSSFFIFNNIYYVQKDGVAMGNPISPSIANYYMQYFEEKALESTSLKPSLWLRYVDDVFAIWPHGRDNLDIFLQHLNNIHKNIQFTMDVEENGTIPFLDVLLEKKDGILIHSVYRKPTHTNQYIHATSHHHPSQKYGTMKCLFNRANSICHKDKIEEEKSLLEDVFVNNGYSRSSIKRIQRPRRTMVQDGLNEENTIFISLPYVFNVTDKISRILARKNIKTAFSPYKKLQHVLRPVKDIIPLQSAGIYKIPCECGKVYIGQTGRTVQTRLNEHRRSIRLNQPDKSSVAEHALNTLHSIKFEDTKIISNPSSFNKRLVREAIEIFKQKENFNHNEGWTISKTWLPVLRNL